FLALAPHADVDAAGAVGRHGLDRLAGVDEQVQDDLAYVRGRTRGLRAVAVMLADLDAPPPELSLQDLQAGIDQIRDVDLLARGRRGPGVGAQAVDDARHPVHALAGAPDQPIEVLLDVRQVDLVGRFADPPGGVGGGPAELVAGRLVDLDQA